MVLSPASSSPLRGEVRRGVNALLTPPLAPCLPAGRPLEEEEKCKNKNPGFWRWPTLPGPDWVQVPWALGGLTSEFGMGSGVTRPLEAPECWVFIF